MSQSVGKVERPRAGLQSPYGSSAEQQTLRGHQILGDPCGTTEGLLAEPHFSHLSAETDRGELKESLNLGFLPLHPVGTLELL